MPERISSIAMSDPITYGSETGHRLILRTPDIAALTIDFIFPRAFAALYSAIGIFPSWRWLSR